MFDSSMIEGTTHGGGRRSVDIYTDRLLRAQDLLSEAVDVVDGRLTALHAAAEAEGVPEEIKIHEGPAFEVHVYGDPADLVMDMTCLEYLEHVARHGRRTGVVVFFHHADLDAVTAALSARTVMAAALMAGKAFRYVQPQPRASWSAGRLPPS